MRNQCPRHQGNVICRRYMSILVKPVTVFKHGFGHAKLRGTFVHTLNKGLLAAAEVFRQSYGRIVCAHNHRGFQQIIHTHRLARLQPDVRSTHRGCVLAGRNHILEINLSAVKSLHHKQQGHYLCDGGTGPLFMSVLFIQHLPGRCLHQDG